LTVWDWPQQWTFIQRWGWFNFQTCTAFKSFSGISQTTLSSSYLRVYFDCKEIVDEL